MRLNKLLSLYTKEKPQLSIKTIEKYQSVINIFIKDNDIDNVYISREVFIKWRSKVLKRSSAINCNNYHRHFKALFNFAVQIGLVKENIFKTVPFLKTGKNSFKLISDIELLELIRFLKTDEYYSKLSWFYLAMIDVFKLTGMRRRQLIGLKWQDLDFFNGVIYLESKYSKTTQENEVPMNTVLKNHFQNIKKKSYLINDYEQVFNITKFIKSYKSSEMTEDHVSALFSTWSNKLSVKISAHRFRHTAATKIVNNCKNIKAAQEMLGHTNVKTTMGYVNIDIDNLRDVQRFL
jgi:integrase